MIVQEESLNRREDMNNSLVSEPINNITLVKKEAYENNLQK